MSKCEKHDCVYEVRQMDRGKTMYVCPECEIEQVEKIRKMFCLPDEPTKPKFPWIGPTDNQLD